MKKEVGAKDSVTIMPCHILEPVSLGRSVICQLFFGALAVLCTRILYMRPLVICLKSLTTVSICDCSRSPV